MVAKMTFPVPDAVDTSHFDGERLLIVEVLRLAMHDWVFYKGETTKLKDSEKQNAIKRAFHSADAFLFGDIDLNAPYSFGWICAHLSDDPVGLVQACRKFLLRSSRASQEDLFNQRNRRMPYRTATYGPKLKPRRSKR